MTDTIADMLIRIKNAYLARKDNISLPHSQLKASIAQVLLDAGYINEVQTQTNEKQQQNLFITLKYLHDEPVLTQVKRVSKPGCRVYVSQANIPAVLHGYGLAILSTSAGILSGQKAKEKGLGGELLCEIW